MSITTCQKVTLISCSVLCVSLFLPRMLLPRAKEDTFQKEVGPGFYPPMMHRAPLSQDPEQWGVDPVHALTHHTETVAKVRGIGRKTSLMTQVIPIYGFGILLYIIYIIYKLTCKAKPPKHDDYITTYKAQMDYTQLNEYELAKLQRRLLQTEQMMEMIVSGKSRGAGSGRSRKSKQSKREEKLLRHLRQITELMQEGRLEGASPEVEAEEVPYFAGWEGYPEETYPEYEDEPCNRKRCKLVPLVVTLSQPTAEALAERMEQEEEDIGPRKLEVLHEEDEEDEEDEEEEIEEEGDEESENITKKEEEEDEEVVDDLEEEEEEEEDASRCLLSPPSPMLASEKKEFLGLELSTELRSHSPGKKITFSDHRDVYRYPREDSCEEDRGGQEQEEEEEEGKEEDEEEEEEESETEEVVTGVREEPGEVDEEDPVMEAESLQFSCEVGSNPEREAEETGGTLTEVGEDSAPPEGPVPEQQPEHWAVSGLRMRNRRDT
ncbi:protein RIC-3 [Boleophthalmus pectinirostris]|uniref:protein RIC-3 n=1 Tax=Boleophthalmus pectinirostris TaxID=150288 RepID=UPI002431C230|nr:protein RIC-3 [Boleophthalmus pectinirostris]